MSSSVNENLKCISSYKNHTEEQIIEAFKVFDEEEKGNIDIKYVETIVRALGRVPRKMDLRYFIKEIRDPESKDIVKLEKLLPALMDILMKDKWRAVPKETLQETFEYMDRKKTGFLSPKYMRELLTENGDKFDDEEIEKFLAFATDPLEETINYTSCVEQMTEPETVDILDEKRKLLVELRDETSYK